MHEGERSTRDARGGEVHERCTSGRSPLDMHVGRGPREMHEGESTSGRARGGEVHERCTRGRARGGEVHERCTRWKSPQQMHEVSTRGPQKVHKRRTRGPRRVHKRRTGGPRKVSKRRTRGPQETHERSTREKPGVHERSKLPAWPPIDERNLIEHPSSVIASTTPGKPQPPVPSRPTTVFARLSLTTTVSRPNNKGIFSHK